MINNTLTKIIPVSNILRQTRFVHFYAPYAYAYTPTFTLHNLGTIRFQRNICNGDL